MQENLSNREKEILRYIVENFIKYALPVGSREISMQTDLNLSSATIRNVMSDLEDLNLLETPHTSAGRKPTDKGYRFYVDSLMNKEALNKSEIKFIKSKIEDSKTSVLDNEDFIRPSENGAFVPAHMKGKIEFRDVSFAYVDDRYVLKQISFTIKPGETVALVGHTGSGKTSIISLLNRMYHIQQGSILIDEVSIEDYNLDALRRNIGVVLQDVFLFSGSVLDNITLRNASISPEKVIEAAKMMGMHEFIMGLPGGYQYHVMERGSTLSLGQRQLLSFIRAVLYNPAILILDEATSSVDTESELLIQQAIEKLVAGRTSIVIAHRLSTIRKASKIIVLDKGEIRETGTHEELMQMGGFYSKLHEMQFNKLPHAQKL